MRNAAGTTQLFQRSVDQTDKHLRNIDKGLNGASAKIRNFTVTLGMARFAMENMRFFFLSWVEAMVGAGANIERTTMLLGGLSTQVSALGRTAEAAKSFEYILNMAKNAPYSISALTNAFVKFKAGGLDPTDGSLRSLVDAVANFGGSDDQLNRASVAIQQMAGKGVISMEELRQQLGEAVPNAMSMMAAGMGITMGELVKRVSTGTVEARSALGKMFAMFELNFGGSARNMMESFAGKLSRVKTGFVEFSMAVVGVNKDGTTGKGTFLAVLKDQLDDLFIALQSPQMKALGLELGNSLTNAALGAGAFVKAIGQINSVVPILKIVTGALMALAAVVTLNLAGTAMTALKGALGGAVTAFRSMGAAVAILHSEMTAYNILVGQATGMKEKFAARSLLAGTAARTFGAAVSASLGPITLIVGALFMAADAFGLLENKAKAAKKAVDDFNRTGIVTEKGMKDTANAVDTLQTKLNVLNDEIKNGMVLENGGRWKLSGEALRRAEAARDATIAQLTAQKQVLQTMKTTQSMAFGTQRGDTWVRTEQQQGRFAPFLEDQRAAFNEYQNIQNKQGVTAKEVADAHERYVARTKKTNAAYIVSLNETINWLAKEQSQYKKGTEKYEANAQAIQNLNAEREKANAAMGKGGGFERLTDPNVYLDPKGKGTAKSDGEKAEDKAATRLAQMQATAAALAADLADGGKELAKIEALLRSEEQGGDPVLSRSSEATKQNLIEAAKQLDNMRDQQEGKRAFADLTDERTKQAATAAALEAEIKAIVAGTEEAIVANARYDAGLKKTVETAKQFADAGEDPEKVAAQAAASQRRVTDLEATKRALNELSREAASSGVMVDDMFEQLYSGAGVSNLALLRYKKTMEEMVLKTAPDLRAEARKFADEAVANFARIDGLKAAEQMREETKRINRGMATDQTEAARQAMEEELVIMWQRVQNAEMTTEQRAKIEADYWAFVLAKQTEFRAQTNPLVAMAQEWGQMTENMKQASASWMDSFVNDLVNGEFSFKKFAKAILADVAKIILRAMIAKAIMAAIGMITGGGSVAMPATQTAMGTETVSAVPGFDWNTFVPSRHGGGMVGNFGGMMSVDPSVFTNAARLHEGGIAGLKPNEVPTILEDGEGVFTKDQMKAMGGKTELPNIQVNVINESGTKMDAQQKGMQFDGRQMVIDVVIDAVSKPGKMRDAFRSAK